MSQGAPIDSGGRSGTPRLDRYKAAVALAQEILADPNTEQDEHRIEQAIQDIRDEVKAGRANQAEWPAHAARALQLLADNGHSASRKIDEPHLRIVRGDVA